MHICKIFTISTFILAFSFFAETKSNCWESKWVKKPLIENSGYRYYVGRASGHESDSEKTLVNDATKDARETAIAENFGILTSVQKQSYQSLDSTTALNRVSEVSKDIILKGFRKKDTCWQLQGKRKNLWILFKYSKLEINKELKRLEKIKFANAPNSFDKISGTGKQGGGFLEIVTSPPGASISVGETHGKTPIQVRLAPGTHEFVLDHPHFKTYEEKIVIGDGKTQRVHKIMERAKRKVQIKTQPEGAEVYLAGKYLGLSPIETSVLTGENLGLLITHSETQPYRTDIKVAKGTNEYILNKRLDFKPSYLFVKSIPQGAEVYLDGKLVGKTPTKFIETRHGTKEVILKKKSHPDYKTHITLKGGERKVLKTIKLNRITNNNTFDIDRGTPLHIACYEGKLEEVRRLIKNGADVNSVHKGKERSSSEILYELEPVPMPTIQKRFVRRYFSCGGGIEFDFSQLRGQKGWDMRSKTPLYKAVGGGHLKVVELLLKSGANPNGNSSWFSPLYKAAGGGHLKVVELLLKSGANPNGNSSSMSSPLEAAAGGGHLKVVELLLKSGANLSRGSELYRALNKAAGGGHLKVVELLLKNGADINIRSYSPSLMAAARKGGLGSSFTFYEKDVDGYSPSLEAAAGGGHLKVVELLLKNGANLNDTSSCSPSLKAAAGGGHLKVVELLLKNGANLNGTSSCSSSLEAAAGGGHLKVVELLLKNGANLNGTSSLSSPLEVAAGGGHLKVVELLLKNGANLNGTSSLSPLYRAAGGGYLKVAELLLKSGANPNGTSSFSSPLHLAARCGHLKVVELLLKSGVNPNVKAAGGVAPLHLAAENGHLKVVELLLKSGVNPNVKAAGGVAPLYLAAGYGHLKVVELLLKSGTNPNVKAAGGVAPLYLAAENGHLKVVELLLKSGANPNVKAAGGVAPLYLAAGYGHLKVVELLLKSGANPNVKAAGGVAPLYLAAGYGHLEVVELLLKSGANPNVKAKEGMTPLHWIARGGHLKLVKLLLQKGANPNVKNKDGFTPFNLAVQKGHPKVADLIKRGVYFEGKDSNNRRPASKN